MVPFNQDCTAPNVKISQAVTADRRTWLLLSENMGLLCFACSTLDRCMFVYYGSHIHGIHTQLATKVLVVSLNEVDQSRLMCMEKIGVATHLSHLFETKPALFLARPWTAGMNSRSHKRALHSSEFDVNERGRYEDGERKDMHENGSPSWTIWASGAEWAMRKDSAAMHVDLVEIRQTQAMYRPLPVKSYF